MKLSSTSSTITSTATSTGANAAISQEPQPSTSSCSANKKLKLLENLACSDDEERSNPAADDTCNVLQESAAYLAPTVLTDDEKVSAVLFWRRHCNAYPYLSEIAKTYLTLSASSVPVEAMFSVAGIVKNSRRSSIAPHRLNRLCFIHDNYGKFFPTQ